GLAVGVELGVAVVGVLQRSRERRELDRLVGSGGRILGQLRHLILAGVDLQVGVGLERRDHALGRVSLQAIVDVGITDDRKLLCGLDELIGVVQRVGVVVAVLVRARRVGEALEVGGVGPGSDLVLLLGLLVAPFGAQRLRAGLVIDGGCDQRVLGQLERTLDRVGIVFVGVVPGGAAQVVGRERVAGLGDLPVLAQRLVGLEDLELDLRRGGSQRPALERELVDLDRVLKLGLERAQVGVGGVDL